MYLVLDYYRYISASELFCKVVQYCWNELILEWATQATIAVDFCHIPLYPILYYGAMLTTWLFWKLYVWLIFFIYKIKKGTMVPIPLLCSRWVGTNNKKNWSSRILTSIGWTVGKLKKALLSFAWKKKKRLEKISIHHRLDRRLTARKLTRGQQLFLVI